MNMKKIPVDRDPDCFLRSAINRSIRPMCSGTRISRTRREKPVRPYDPALPDVLIIGDSISIGYTPCVAQELSGTANVFHLEKNCQGATFICQNIDRRLQHPRPWRLSISTGGCTASSAGFIIPILITRTTRRFIWKSGVPFSAIQHRDVILHPYSGRSGKDLDIVHIIVTPALAEA
jgi:hypothetical protein